MPDDNELIWISMEWTHERKEGEIFDEETISFHVGKVEGETCTCKQVKKEDCPKTVREFQAAFGIDPHNHAYHGVFFQ